MLASTFLDLVVGLDIHFEMVPMPVPTPTPIPHPFMGMVGDLKALAMNLIVSNVVEMAMAGEIKPPKGPVLINLLPATNTGTDVKNKTVLPHFVIPPGTMWTPMPKAPKPKIGLHEAPPPDPPVAPAGDAVLMMGSKTVTLMGSNAVRFGDLAMSCSEPLRMPSSTVMALPKGLPVIIGGPPAIDWTQAAGALLRSKWVSNELHGLVSRIKSDRLRNLLAKGVCFLTGHPVDVASGRMLTWATDWNLPGHIPLAFERNYASSWSGRDSVLGRGWSHSLDEAVWLERGRVVYRAGDGREIEFNTFDLPGHAMSKGDQIWEPINRLTLRCRGPLSWEIESATDGFVREFEPHQIESHTLRSRLSRIRSRADHEIRLEYDHLARLASVRDSAGRIVRFEHDRLGRLCRVFLPHPQNDGWVVHTEYRYSDAGDLEAVVDPLGHITRYQYSAHLMVRETDRTGLSYYFGYDGAGSNARCVRTWGDGGVFDHEIAYDAANHLTFVTNSLGHTTMYVATPVGAVVKIVDPLGGTTEFAYDQNLRVTKRTDPLGHAIEYAYDDRGNRTGVTYPDGSTLGLEYDTTNRVVGVVDAAEQRWSWEYDCFGPTRHVTPVGERFRWTRSRDGSHTVFTIGGQVKTVLMDEGGLTTRFARSTGAKTRLSYDRRGRLVEQKDQSGNREVRTYDGCGRVASIREVDGTETSFTWDAEGFLQSMTDGKRMLRLDYSPAHVLSRMHDNVGTISWEYDRECRPIALRDQLGAERRLGRDELGHVVALGRPDGSVVRYVRDPAGRIAEVVYPSGRTTTYKYDPAGRVVEQAYADGTKDAYSYSPVGSLEEARNESGTLKYECDAAGRVVKEIQDDKWVSSEYDPSWARVSAHTSLGGHQTFKRDGAAQSIAVQFTYGDGAGEVGYERSPAGDEITRYLPGDVIARWQRTPAGLPQTCFISSNAERERGIEYTWQRGGRLSRVVDSELGPTEFHYDAADRLVGLRSGGGDWQRRALDGAGNPFPDGETRTYAETGRLEVAGDTRFEYDVDGRIVTRVHPDETRDTFKWDARGLLRQVTDAHGRITQFEYDPLGRRTAKRTDQGATSWLWDGNTPIQELSTERPPTMWVFAPESFELVASVRANGEVLGFLTDLTGAPQLAFDKAGHLAWSATMDLSAGVSHIEGDATVPWRWPGQYHDEETGLTYNRYRYYDPASSRYISPDPLGPLDSLSAYAYPANPIWACDPWGLIIVFRNLRPDQSPASGLDAKLPGRDMSPAGHVRNGSNPDFKGSQYISTTADPAVAAQWREPGQVTVMIDTDSLVPDALGNKSVVNLSTPELAAAEGLKGPAKNYAAASREVLLEGHVPPEGMTELSEDELKAKCA